MIEYFGAISPFLLTAIASALTQWVKVGYPNLPARKLQLIALAFNVVLFVPFILLTAETLGFFTVYQAFVYTIMAWLMSIGFYEVVIKKQ